MRNKFQLIAISALLFLAYSPASAATVFQGGNLNSGTSWTNGLPSAGNDGTIAVDGINGSGVFNFGGSTIVNQSAGTIISSDEFNLTADTWNLSGGEIVTRYFLSNGSSTTINLSGGLVELADVSGAQHIGVVNNGTLNISGAAVLDGTQATTVVQTDGAIDIASDWTGSWTWGIYAGDDWKNLFTSSAITFDGMNIDGTTFDNLFAVTGGGQTLALNPVPEPATLALAAFGLLLMVGVGAKSRSRRK